MPYRLKDDQVYLKEVDFQDSRLVFTAHPADALVLSPQMTRTIIEKLGWLADQQLQPIPARGALTALQWGTKGRKSLDVLLMSESVTPLDLVIESLSYWQREFILNLREQRPTLLVELQTAGTLIDAAEKAEAEAQAAFDQLYQAYLQDYPAEVAQSMAQSAAEQDYIYLPSEREVPVLGEPPVEASAAELADVEHLKFLEDLTDNPPL